MREILAGDLEFTTTYKAVVGPGDVTVRARHRPTNTIVTVTASSELAGKAAAITQLQGELNDEGADLGVQDQRTLSEHLADIGGLSNRDCRLITEHVKLWIGSFIEAGYMTLDDLLKGADD